MQLYYHKTDGGAEYLTDKFIPCPDGHKEGIFEGAKYIVRIDGDITKDAELTVRDETDQTETDGKAMKVYLQKRHIQKYAGYDAVATSLITKRKIEALPELLEALIGLQKEIKHHIRFNVKKHYSLMVQDAAATKAIAKATITNKEAISEAI